MGENSIFSVFSNIWSSVRLIISLNSKLLGNTDCLHWIWTVLENDSFIFYLSIAVHLLFLYLITDDNSVLLLYDCAHKISLKYLFPEKIVIEICCQKCHGCNRSYKPITNTRGFTPSFVNYKKGALDSQPHAIKFTSCLPMVGGSHRVLRLPPPLKLIAMIYRTQNNINVFLV